MVFAESAGALKYPACLFLAMLEVFGVILSAVGTLMALTHGGTGGEDIAMKQLFIGLIMLLGGMVFIFFKPAQII